MAGGAAPYNPRTAVCAYSPGMSQGDEIIYFFPPVQPNFTANTLRSETFADQPNREIIVFRGNKLSRMANFKIFRGNKLSREKKK